MGIKIAPDAFQNVMSKLVQDMEYVKTYLDELLILTNRMKQLQRSSTLIRNGSSKSCNK
jgi:hypothetical protein